MGATNLVALGRGATFYAGDLLGGDIFRGDLQRGTIERFIDAPPGRWAVVTSGVRAVAEHRLRHVGLPVPPVMVCADEVTHGKPHPDVFLEAARRLGVEPAKCLVFEDSLIGVQAACAAGMKSFAVPSSNHQAIAERATRTFSSLCDVTADLVRRTLLGTA